MIKNAFLLCLVFAAAVRFAAADSTAQQALDADRKTVDIRAAGAKPFQLEADLTAQLDTSVKGHVTVRWSGPQLWSIDITMGDFHQLEIHKGDTVYTSRNTALAPARVDQLEELLAVLGDNGEWQPRKLKLHSEIGVSMQCVEMRLRNGGTSLVDPERQVCSNRVTGEVMSDITHDSQARSERNFADYRTFGAYRYPWQLSAFENGTLLVQVQVVSLQEATLDTASFTPAADAIVRRHCANLKAAEPVRTADAIFPTGVPERNLGAVTAQVIILPNGTMESAHLLQSINPDIDRAAIEALRKWTFKPATCGNEAVTSDLQVEINFHTK